MNIPVVLRSEIAETSTLAQTLSEYVVLATSITCSVNMEVTISKSVELRADIEEEE